MLSNTCKYALRAIIYIGKNCQGGKRVNIKNIAENIDVPSSFIAKILQNLVKEKLISSVKGPHGGFSIVRKLEDITLYDIVEVIEGERFFNSCLVKHDSCIENHSGEYCPVHSRFVETRTKIIEFYKQTSIADVVVNISDEKYTVKM